MEPSDQNELSHHELDAMLREWKIPAPPDHLRHSLFGNRTPWWKASLRIPLPLAMAVTLLITVAVWKWPRPMPAPAPRIEYRNVRVEVPIEKKQVVTRIVYRDRPPKGDSELRPVTELRPRIIRSRNAD